MASTRWPRRCTCSFEVVIFKAFGQFAVVYTEQSATKFIVKDYHE